MRTTGKLLLIFGIIALVSAIAFGFTVAAFGVTNGDYSISLGGREIGDLFYGGSAMENILPGNAGILFRHDMTNINEDFEKNKEYRFSFGSDTIKDIAVSLASCDARIICSDAGTAEVIYKTGDMKVNFAAVLEDGKLTVTEKNGSWFNFGSFRSSDLTLTVPKQMYESVKLNLASGTIHSTDLTADSIDANAASGTMELGAFADDMTVQIASGKMVLDNCTDRRASSVKVEAASGKIEMNGFKADRTKVELASGKADLTGISGNVDCEAASGTINLSYAEWDGDLSVELLSGKVDVTLPAGSGIDVNYKRASGSMKTDLDGQSLSPDGNTSFKTGGDNVHSVDAHTLSGSINVHN